MVFFELKEAAQDKLIPPNRLVEVTYFHFLLSFQMSAFGRKRPKAGVRVCPMLAVQKGGHSEPTRTRPGRYIFII